MEINPFEAMNADIASTKQKERLNKLSKKINKTPEVNKLFSEIILGIAQIEDIDLDALKDPEFLNTLESVAVVKNFLNHLNLDAASEEALSVLRVIISSPDTVVRDKIQAANSILNNRSKREKDIYDHIQAIKQVFSSNTNSQDISALKGDEITTAIFNIINYAKK